MLVASWPPHPTQNVSVVCAPFLCCKKIESVLLWFLDIRIIFIGLYEVTQPPTCAKFDPNRLVCLFFVCAGKSLVCAASVFLILDNQIIGGIVKTISGNVIIV